MVPQCIGDSMAQPGRDGDHGGDLDQTDLQSIGGSDFHGEGNVAVHGEGDGVHELGHVGDQGE